MAWDDFLDDLQDRAEDAFSNVTSKVIDQGVQSLGFLKIGKPPQSNLTAQQVQSGQSGAPPSNVVAQQGPSSFMGSISSYLPYIIIVLIVGAAFLFRRK